MPLVKIISIIFCTGIALLPFGAVYWSEALGTLSASPGLFCIFIALLIAPFSRIKHIPIFLTLKLLRLVKISILGSVISLLIFDWSQYFAYKFVTLFILTTVWMSPLFLSDFIKLEHLKKSVIIALVICIFAYFFSDFLNVIPDPISKIIFSEKYLEFHDDRPRGFMEETSQFSATVARYMIILYLLYESPRIFNPKRLITFFIILSLPMVLFSSKGAVLTAAIALLSCCLSLRQMPYLIFLGPLAYWLIEGQADALIADFNYYTSAGTRISMALSALSASILNPIGYGYYGFYPAMNLFGAWILEIVTNILSVRLDEARDIIENYNNVSFKSTVLDFMVVFGWFFIKMLRDIIIRIDFKDPRVRACAIFFSISSLTTSGHLSITFFLGATVLLKCFPKDRTNNMLLIK